MSMAIDLLSCVTELVVGERCGTIVVVVSCLLNLTWCPEDACSLVFEMDMGL